MRLESIALLCRDLFASLDSEEMNSSSGIEIGVDLFLSRGTVGVPQAKRTLSDLPGACVHVACGNS